MRRLPFFLISMLTAAPALSHEFWISPQDFVLGSDAQVQADIRVGQKFKGGAYSYRESAFERFDVVIDGTTTPVQGRLGDVPALSMHMPGNGLAIIVHETTDNLLTYKEWPKFIKFVEHKAFPTTLEDHVARGIQTEGFEERYRRFAKSLVARGTGVGNDQEVGLKTEIVALENPYLTTKGTLPVKVLLDGAPRRGVQVELFDKDPEGDVEITLHRTDDQGVATIPIVPGHQYLVDAVEMLPLENDDPDAGPVWWSLWASLTFQVPEHPLR